MAASCAAAEWPADALPLLEPLPDELVAPLLEEPEELPDELLLLVLPDVATFGVEVADEPVAVSTETLPQAPRVMQIVAAAASSSWDEPRCGMRVGLAVRYRSTPTSIPPYRH